MQRRFWISLCLILLVTVIGGASRLSITEGFPSLYRDYAGDIFWALLVYLCLGTLFPKWSIVRIALLTLCFAYSIEILQLYQAPWIQHLRKTWFGMILLGSGFLWSDFVCYSLGCLLGIGIDLVYLLAMPKELTNS